MVGQDWQPCRVWRAAATIILNFYIARKGQSEATQGRAKQKKGPRRGRSMEHVPIHRQMHMWAASDGLV
jgi:hypothetical protein